MDDRSVFSRIGVTNLLQDAFDRIKYKMNIEKLQLTISILTNRSDKNGSVENGFRCHFAGIAKAGRLTDGI